MTAAFSAAQRLVWALLQQPCEEWFSRDSSLLWLPLASFRFLLILPWTRQTFLLLSLLSAQLSSAFQMFRQKHLSLALSCARHVLSLP
ncbi:hypothetical protein [Paracoccus amoyensis]|uniref:hypothetical protein n=1 Tax=Paracoccus amoyensis TaxID=2760093 RepID=UPI001FE994D7|nr:hypothetical protein [Paracoccus amoyensis]